MAAAGTSWSDAQVRAFVEGQLDAEATAQFSAQVRHDLALAERVARQRALKKHPGGTQAVGTPASPQSRRVPIMWWPAAALAVVIAALAGWSLPRGSDEALQPDADGLAAGGRLAQALEERIAAEGSKAGGVLVSLSFQAGDGRYCRTFSLDTGIDGLACRSAQQWQIEAIGRSPRAEPAAAATAREVSSELSPAVIAAISRWQAGDALTPEQERRVRERDWQ